MGEQVENKRIQIDADDLTTAIQDNSEMIWFLDLETGEVRNYWDGMLDAETVDEDFDIDEFLESDQYRTIEGISSHKNFETTEEFIESLPDGHAKQRLAEAILRRKPFRQFKDALFDLGDVRDQWFKFEEQAQLQAARRWLEDEEIDADLVLPERLK